MSEVCEKHGPYSTFCRECDLDTIEKFRGRVADPAPELLTRAEVHEMWNTLGPEIDDQLAMTALAAYDDTGRLWRDVAAEEKERADTNEDTAHGFAMDWAVLEGRLDMAELRAANLTAELAAAERVGADLVVQNGQLERRAIRAEAALVAAQEAIEAVREAAAREIEEAPILENADAQAWAKRDIALAAVVRALPIPAAKPEGE